METEPKRGHKSLIYHFCELFTKQRCVRICFGAFNTADTMYLYLKRCKQTRKVAVNSFQRQQRRSNVAIELTIYRLHVGILSF